MSRLPPGLRVVDVDRQSVSTYFRQLGRAIGAPFHCIACGRPSRVRRLMCSDCHREAEQREPGPWALARRAERAAAAAETPEPQP